jgi:hypothetical protein
LDVLAVKVGREVVLHARVVGRGEPVLNLKAAGDERVKKKRKRKGREKEKEPLPKIFSLI